jgi:hypothetical protein
LNTKGKLSLWLALGVLVLFLTAAVAETVVPFGRPALYSGVSNNFPTYGSGGKHRGNDIQGAKYSAIFAVRSGKVRYAKSDGSYGNIVSVRDKEFPNLDFRYAHLDFIVAKQGADVEAGDLIGYMGETGNVTGVHLHLECAWKGNATTGFSDTNLNTCFTRKSGYPANAYYMKNDKPVVSSLDAINYRLSYNANKPPEGMLRAQFSYPANLKTGSSWILKGAVISPSKLNYVDVWIENASGKRVAGMTKASNPNNFFFDIHSVDSQVKMQNVSSAGTYYYCISAKNESGDVLNVKQAFTASGSTTSEKIASYKSTASLPEEPVITGATYPTTLSNGQSFGLRGTVSCRYPITEIRAKVTNRVTKAVIFNVAVTPNANTYAIGNPTSEPINDKLAFNSSKCYDSYLNYSLTVTYTKDGASLSKVVLDKNFKVGSPAGSIPVDSVALSPASVTLSRGETALLTAKISPDDAGNKNVAWSSSDVNVASVSNGTVTAVGPGSAVITVRTTDGAKTASCLVTVRPITGKCGQNVTWTLGGSPCTLSIDGSGPIDDYASAADQPWYEFRGKIETVKVGGTVTAIGERAFEEFSALKSVQLPASIARVGARAFRLCGALGQVALPDGCTFIGAQAFDGCYALTSFRLPASLTYLGARAFHNCRLVERYDIPEGVQAILANPLINNYALKTITVPSSVTSIAGDAFENCAGFTIRCFAGSAAHAFARQNGIDYVLIDTAFTGADFTLPKATKTVAANAFAAIGARRVQLPEGLTAIGKNAFANCKNLTAVYIPQSCDQIDESAFTGVSGLTIFGRSGSFAETFAKQHGFDFVAVR